MPSDAHSKLPQIWLSDEPSTVDRFGQHSRIAEALHELVMTDSDAGLAIALTGAWGSGKSTVLALLRERLRSHPGSVSSPPETARNPQDSAVGPVPGQENTFGPALFVFDAWQHQGDPLRRSFLESLLEFSAKAGMTEATCRKWSEDLDLQTGRRQISKTTTARPISRRTIGLFLVVGVLLPLANTLFGKFDPTKQWTWDSWQWESPVLYVICLTLLGYELFRKEGAKELARAIKDFSPEIESTVVRTRDASSLDFQRLFRSITIDLCEKHSRLVVVVDNLDRVEADDARAMWTTIRAMLDLGDARWVKNIRLIVPFDRSALGKIQQHEKVSHQDTENAVDAFLNKTFQAVIHLPPPVFMRFREYFREQMEALFEPACVRKHFEEIYRIYGRLSVNENAEPGRPNPPELWTHDFSPRSVKTFLNALRLQWLIWSAASDDKRVLLPCLAVQVLKVRQLTQQPSRLIRSDFLDLSIESVLTLALQREGIDGDWRRQIAAAHFCIEPKDAAQAVLAEQFGAAFTSGRIELLDDLATEEYFPLVFKAYCDCQHDRWTKGTIELTYAVRFLDKWAHRFGNHADDLWKSMLANLSATAGWETLEDAHLDAVDRVLANASPSSAQSESIGGRILEAASRFGIKPLEPALELLDRAVGIVSSRGGKGALSNFRVEFTDAGYFVAAQAAALQLGLANGAARFLRIEKNAMVLNEFADRSRKLDDSAFVRLRAAVVEGSDCTYGQLNSGVLAQQSNDLAFKLNRIFAADAPEACQLADNGFSQIEMLAGNSSYSPEFIAAAVILAGDRVDEPRYRELKRGNAITDDMIAAATTCLVSWRQAHHICDVGWWIQSRAGLTPRMIWHLTTTAGIHQLSVEDRRGVKGRLAEFWPELAAQIPVT